MYFKLLSDSSGPLARKLARRRTSAAPQIFVTLPRRSQNFSVISCVNHVAAAQLENQHLKRTDATSALAQHTITNGMLSVIMCVVYLQTVHSSLSNVTDNSRFREYFSFKNPRWSRELSE
ncbi:unnamed protein product [Acanthoscelides obtectus]|uniref:Uncharacterized protein n=1 Tax=Acanthoscelides obtectus TaxID=200917 RepID=A0A9P0MDP0_ACAOB|nr:unnamed protein product [Acanthoscelides obtectus]CAK1677535.1 hypothetical protein AOBTE_LOCUS31388 [Acanthoscelides obtectus]